MFKTGKLFMKVDKAKIAKYDVLMLTGKLAMSFVSYSHQSNVP
jgi:hypothetical protein